MCVATVAWRAHPRWRVVLAGNRDEFHARDAAPLARWHCSDIIAGRDLRSGGTWLGVSPTRLAVVANLGGYLPDPTAPSRGALVTGALTGALPDDAALGRFNPFNLIVVDRDRAHVVTNRPRAEHAQLTPDIHGLSNGAVDSDWPKVRRLNALLAAWLAGAADDPEILFDALAEDRETPLVRSPSAEHEPRARIFIRNATYGTRCSTVVAVDAEGVGTILERRYDSDAAITGETRLPFVWGD